MNSAPTQDSWFRSGPDTEHASPTSEAEPAAETNMVTDEAKEEERGESDVQESRSRSGRTPQPEVKAEVKERPRIPAYVAPIGKIGSIAPVPPGISIGSGQRPLLPPLVGLLLQGRRVDEYGDIVDEQTGAILARAGGDLPSLVGRTVSNRDGDILGDGGELLGYVADLDPEGRLAEMLRPPPSQNQKQKQRPRSLFEVMGRSNSSLMVDQAGQILDVGGNVVGTFHDNNNPLHRKEREEKGKGKLPEAGPTDEPADTDRKEEEPEERPEAEEERAEGARPTTTRRTESERRKNAEDWRKEKPGESPSDIFLDVKSTHEGIQLTIRIPTVFSGQQVKPNITFSS